LEDVGKSSAETNFEKLKRASDQKAKDASELIASLKKELVEVRKSTSSASTETTGLQKQIDSLTSSNQKLTAERDDLKGKFQVSQNEVKSLEAKLMTARQQISHSAQEAETAAKKLNISTAMTLGDAQKEAKMKENLYADLTGLLIRAVKRKDGEDEYDCIQTGRNGSK
jgi:chromosome segregation ATPase